MCNDCGKENHLDQVENYPVGANVVNIRPLAAHDKIIEVGNVGVVTGHCDDGRAVIDFRKYPNMGHTFHYIEQCLVVAYPEG